MDNSTVNYYRVFGTEETLGLFEIKAKETGMEFVTDVDQDGNEIVEGFCFDIGYLTCMVSTLKGTDEQYAKFVEATREAVRQSIRLNILGMDI